MSHCFCHFHLHFQRYQIQPPTASQRCFWRRSLLVGASSEQSTSLQTSCCLIPQRIWLGKPAASFLLPLAASKRHSPRHLLCRCQSSQRSLRRRQGDSTHPPLPWWCSLPNWPAPLKEPDCKLACQLVYQLSSHSRAWLRSLDGYFSLGFQLKHAPHWNFSRAGLPTSWGVQSG